MQQKQEALLLTEQTKAINDARALEQYKCACERLITDKPQWTFLGLTVDYSYFDEAWRATSFVQDTKGRYLKIEFSHSRSLGGQAASIASLEVVPEITSKVTAISRSSASLR